MRHSSKRRNRRRDELRYSGKYNSDFLRRAASSWNGSADHVDDGYPFRNFSQHLDHQPKLFRDSVSEDPVQYPDDADAVDGVLSQRGFQKRRESNPGTIPKLRIKGTNHEANRQT